MFCSNCHKNLEEFGAFLDKMENCPLCGGHLLKEPKEVPQESFESFCTDLVKTNGKDVFASDESLFQAIACATPNFEDARDKMSLLTIKQIPSKIYAAKDFPEDEIAYIINQCQKQLVLNLGVSFDVSKEMLLALQKAIYNKVIPISALYTGESFVDSRDVNIYRTVKIGDQIWMAENLKYKCDGCEAYGNDYSYWAKYGYLYNSDALKSVAPDGWRVPTQSDFEKLFSFVTRTHKEKDWHKCLLANDASWGKGQGGTDEFGFGILPGGRYGSGYYEIESAAYFWSTDSGTCALSISRCFWAWEGMASVRLIKDDSKPSKKR